MSSCMWKYELREELVQLVLFIGVVVVSVQYYNGCNDGVKKIDTETGYSFDLCGVYHGNDSTCM